MTKQEIIDSIESFISKLNTVIVFIRIIIFTYLMVKQNKYKIHFFQQKKVKKL